MNSQVLFLPPSLVLKLTALHCCSWDCAEAPADNLSLPTSSMCVPHICAAIFTSLKVRTSQIALPGLSCSTAGTCPHIHGAWQLRGGVQSRGCCQHQALAAGVLRDGWAVQGNVTYYCIDRQSGGQCPQPTAAQIAAFQSGMQACFRRAVDVGFTTLAVAPHLDDGLGLGEPSSAPIFLQGSWAAKRARARD